MVAAPAQRGAIARAGDWLAALLTRLLPGRRGRIAGYGAARTMVEGIFALRGLALGALLGPEAFGVWAVFRLVMRYASFAGLGILRGVEVEGSRTGAGRDGAVEAKAYVRAAAAFFVLAFGSLAGLAVVVALMAPTATVALVALGIALVLPLERLWRLNLVAVRASGRLRACAELELVEAALNCVLVVVLALVFGLAGAFAGVALAIATGLVLAGRHISIRPAWNGARVGRLFHLGAPIGLSGLLLGLLTSADRLAVGTLLGVEMLGQYAFAVALSGFGAILGLVVRTVVFPDLFRQVRRDGAAAGARRLFADTLLPFAWFLPPALGLIALPFELVLVGLLPDFAAAAAPARVFVFVGVASGLISLTHLGVMAGGRQTRLPVITALASGASIGLSFLVLIAGFGLAGLAAAVLLSRLAYAVAVIQLAAPHPVLSRVGDAGLVVGPTLICALALTAIDALLPLTSWSGLTAAIVLYLGLAAAMGFAARRIIRHVRSLEPALAGTPAQGDLAVDLEVPPGDMLPR